LPTTVERSTASLLAPRYSPRHRFSTLFRMREHRTLAQMPRSAEIDHQ
jgi:hypothetical protein